MTERITSRKNAVVKRLAKLGRDKSFRFSEREFVCDGRKLLSEAIEAGAEITSVLADEESFESLPYTGCGAVYTAPKGILEFVSTLKSPQEVIFSCSMRDNVSHSVKRAVMLDGLQDTGNVGTIIRTADAFGIDAVYIDNCADIYNPKTIRSAMGSLFRVTIIPCSLDEEIPRLRQAGMRIYSSELHADSVSVGECDLSESCAVVIGNEGNGVRNEISKLCEKSVVIPMCGGAESLNASVAEGIFMYLMSTER